MNAIIRILRSTGPARFILLFGILLLLFGVLMLSFHTDSYLETVGTVTSVVEAPRLPDEEQQYDVSIVYTVEGKQYENVFSNLGSGYKAGDSIKVYYDPADPSAISNAKLGILPIVVIVVGGLMALYGTFRFVRALATGRG